MSGTFPSDPSPATVELISKQPTDVSRAESGKRQARITGGHLWSAKFSWSRMTKDMLSPIFAFAARQKGRFGSFQIVLPNYATHRGDGTGSIKVYNAHSAGASSIVTDGWSGTTVMKENDIVSFASHSKVYMLIIDLVQAGGFAAMNIEPPLIQDVPDNDVVTINGVEFTMSLDDDVIPWKGSAPNMAILTADMTESL